MRRLTREISWLLPFLSLMLAALALLRPAPVIPPEITTGRVIIDARGTKAIVPLHPKVIYSGISVWYLEAAHSPDTLAYIGKQGEEASFTKGTMGRIYPMLARDAALWHRRGGTFEAMLAEDRSYTYLISDPTELRRWGLNAVTWSRPNRPDNARPGDAALSAAIWPDPGWTPPGWGTMKMSWFDPVVLNHTMISNRVLGQDRLAEQLIADYTTGYRSLVDDLRPDALASRPRVIHLLAWRNDWSKARLIENDPVDNWREGVSDASEGFQNSGREQETERVLAMNPDIMFTSEPVADFMKDPRWQGLKAVREHRVYNAPLRDFRDSSGGTLLGLTYNPLWARWVAEVAHPGIMPGGLRDRLRAHLEKLYDYRLSDAEIDELLNVTANRHSANSGRFMAPARKVPQ